MVKKFVVNNIAIVVVSSIFICSCAFKDDQYILVPTPSGAMVVGSEPNSFSYISCGSSTKNNFTSENTLSSKNRNKLR